MQRLTRRQAIIGGAATLAVTRVGASTSSLTGLSVASSDPITRVITLFQASDPHLADLLDIHFPLYRMNPGLASMLPLTVIIRNGGKYPVKAYSFRWTVTEADEEKTVFSRLFVSRPSAEHPRIIGTGRNAVLQPGQVAVVTPLFLWSASRYIARRGVVPVNDLMNAQSEAANFVSDITPGTVYNVRRNAKICDKAAIGDDTDCATDYEVARNAERDAAGTLVTLEQGNRSVNREALLDDLQGMSTSDNTIATSDAYGAARRAYLGSLTARAKRFPVDVVMSQNAIVAARSVTTLVRKPRTHVVASHSTSGS
jgi:hypothetical protein